MKKLKRLVKTVTGGLLGGSQPKAQPINIPAAVIPAAPAPTARQDTGADIVIGSQSTMDDRVSGGATKKRVGDPLGSLGVGGLRI